MTACPSCGRENADDARFCSACGTALAVTEAPREQRKVVTVLFCDLVGSTALGESTDPEALRGRMRRYFDDLRAILERHGGTVEKFVGDAVMAVFGIPTAHEDDALRAVRAAAEMRAAIAEHGLEARIGINTGEVVVGGEIETLVTGDAVNVAARLEQAAPNGEILIGGETRQLVRDAVQVEGVEPLALKGKSGPVEAFRLLEVIADAEPLARHPETPLVGRERERLRLWRAYEDAVAERSCQLFTLLGPAGIGKSRLVADFLERVGDSADVLRGRCLSYGEGITYWPLVEILLAIGVEPDSVIGSSPPETQLAFRRLLEARAAECPQVVVIDDLQWAEPVFVDLVEHVSDLSRDAPIFLLCIARTELLDAQPGWGGGKLNATSLLLEPLGADECDELMERLGAHLDDELRARITTASAGNPLYVEEMLAMVREHGGDREIAVPPTIHALLQARIDSLERDVRVVMERGSVEGEVFHRGAVAVLAPDPVRDGVSEHLTTLVRKELIRSTPPTFPDDEGFRFRHLLIRDAAYESLPKATRAELHERFADWLADHDLVERDEIMGYHLERAHRYRAELDPNDAALGALARRAAERLEASSRAAADRGDSRAACILLGRAHATLPPDDPRRDELAPDLALYLMQAGDMARATEVVSPARASDDEVVAALALIVDSWIAAVVAGGTTADRREAMNAALGVLEGAGHDDGIGLYWRTSAGEPWSALRARDALAGLERALEHFVRGGSTEHIDVTVWWMRAAYALGPTPVGEALERMDGLDELVGPSLVRDADSAVQRARVLSMQGDLARAYELIDAARGMYLEAGLGLRAGMAMYFRSWVDERAGDAEALEESLRTAMSEQHAIGAQGYVLTIMGHLAVCLYELGRLHEARELIDGVRAETSPSDLANLVYAEALEGCLLAHDGRIAEARQSGRRALELISESDFYYMRAIAHLLVAEIEGLAGDAVKASELAGDAVAGTEAKGDIAFAARLRHRFADLGIEVA